MAAVGEVASLFGLLGLRVDEAAWSKGDAKIRGMAAQLDGAFADKSGRWRAASGRFLSMGEKAGLAAAGVKGFGDAAETAGGKAAKAGGDAASSFSAAATAIKGYLFYLGARSGYDHLIKSNQQAQDETIALAAIIEGNLGGSFDDATAKAKGLREQWQAFALAGAPVKTRELTEFGKNIAAATFSAGGNVKDVGDIAQQGIIASKVLTPERGAAYASLELSEMLMGVVNQRMVFSKLLLRFAHMNEEEFRGLNEKQRLNVVKAALNSQGMKDASKAMMTSFTGVTSTAVDLFELAGKRMGAPIFEKITRGAQRFNEWVGENQKSIDALVDRVGNFLARAFDAASAAIGIVVEKGGALIEWIGKFLDGGELVKSSLIALGALLTAFAIQSMIAFAANPITLIVLGVTALIYAIRKLMDYPGGVKQAFHDAWEAIKSGAHAAWEAIKDGFSAAFDFVADLPVIKQLIALVKALSNLGTTGAETKEGQAIIDDIKRLSQPDAGLYGSPANAPSLPVSSAGGTPAPVSVGPVSVGDIHVNAPNADPVAVADEVRKTFHEELGNVLRSTMDQVA